MRALVRRAATVICAVAVGSAASTAAAHADEPEGTAFGAPCGTVTILAVPGSNETTESAGMDVARGALADVVQELGPRDASVRVHFLGYPARLNPYDDSRSHGYQAAWSTVDHYARQCPSTVFILTGYSQGAHIAGDLAATIGREGSPVSPDRVRSVRLLADPARDPDVRVVGSGGSAGGLLGHRGEFGSLDDRVTEYCNADDLFCNDTVGSTVGSLASNFGAHTGYQHNTVPDTDQTYTRRMADDLVQDVVNLNGATF